EKIPVEWAEDDWILPEIKPRSEERRRYAEEKRPRMAARGGRPGGGGRGGGGRPGGRHGGAPRRGRPHGPGPQRSPPPSGEGEGRVRVAENTIELSLPHTERQLLSALAEPWRDLLYVPGPDFTSPLEPGLCAACRSRRCRSSAPRCSARSSSPRAAD